MRKPTRQEIWAHNALLGAASMIRASAERIMHSQTATDDSRARAEEIYDKVSDLTQSLKTRRDQE